MESRGRKVPEGVGVGCLVPVLMEGSGILSLSQRPAQPSCAPRMPAAHEDFYTFGIAELKLVYFREKFLSEVFRGWNLTPPCCRRQSLDSVECPEARVCNRALGEELEHHPLLLSL